MKSYKLQTRLFCLMAVLVLLFSTVSLADEWTCSNCGQINNSRFCIYCAQPSPAPLAEGEWACSCGKIIQGKFCMYCGNPSPAPSVPDTPTPAPSTPTPVPFTPTPVPPAETPLPDVRGSVKTELRAIVLSSDNSVANYYTDKAFLGDLPSGHTLHLALWVKNTSGQDVTFVVKEEYAGYQYTWDPFTLAAGGSHYWYISDALNAGTHTIYWYLNGYELNISRSLQVMAGASVTPTPKKTPTPTPKKTPTPTPKKTATPVPRTFKLDKNFTVTRGVVRITWQDSANASPYKVSYQYVDSSSTAKQTRWNLGSTNNKSITCPYMVPGCTYKIVVTDANNKTAETTFKFPKADNFVDGKLTSESNFKFAFEGRYLTDTEYTNKQWSRAHSVKLKGSEMAAGIKYDKNHYGLYFKLDYPGLSYDRCYNRLFVFFAPNGYMDSYFNENETYESKYGWYYWDFLGSSFFDKLYEDTGTIPSGTYKFLLYWDGMFVKKTSFTVK